MKKIYSVIFIALLSLGMKATSYTVAISGFAYSPATLTVTIGDIVTIQASGNHPLAEVSQTTWAAQGTSTLSTGFGTKTTNYTFTVTTASDIYYVCTAHVGSMNMKGMIVVSTTGINEQDASLNSVSIFPNPAKDKFSVKFNSSDSNISVKLYSICGQEIEALSFRKETNAGFTSLNFDLENKVPAGVYFLQLTSNSKKVTKKIIID